MDVRLPDGTVIKGVPDDMSKADLTAKLKSNGYDVSKLEAPSGGIPVGRQGAAGIPTEPGANLTPTATEPRSLYQRVMGNIETLPALAGGAVGGVVAPIAQLGHELTQGQAFTPEGKAAAAKFGQQVQQQFYQPRTEEAQRNVQAIGDVVVPMAGLHMGGPVNALAPAIRAGSDIARSEGSLISGATSNALANRAANTQAANVAKSYASAPIIDAAQAADRTGLAVNPAITNPTFANRAKGMAVGPAFEDAAAKVNATQTTKLVRKDLGVAPDQPLNAAAVDTALDNASKPYDAVRKIPSLTPDNSVTKSMEALRVPKLIGDEGASAKVNALIDTAIEEVNNGRSGALVVDDIRQLRKQAQNVYKARDAGSNPAAADLAAADARMGIANALESLIDANAPNRKVLADLQAARTRMAQIYDHDRAINYANQTVDPQVYAKLLDERKGNMTGVGADIGKVAATFPEVMSTQTPTAQRMPKVTRSGLGAAAGALAGGAIAGYPGAIGGATLGGTAGFFGTQIAAKNMVNPAYQAARAMPTDYRPAPNMLRPVEPNYGPNQMTPYVAPIEVLTPGQGTQFPNFTMQGEPTFGAAPTPYAQRSLPNEVPKQIYQAQKNAELAQEFRAAAERKPMGRELQFDLDPITGKLVPTSAGVRGATPEVFQADTGVSLKSATDKVASGQQFAMSAAEKVAWDKTRVDLASAAPELRGLSDKEVASKIMDRQWVADTISKIKEKIAAFDEIAKRDKSAEAIRQSAIEREKLTDKLMTLEDTLRPPRPVSRTTQGPKTRAAQRNQLMSGQSSQNALAP